VADSFGVLYQDQLPAVAAALYTVPASTQAIIKHIKLLNTSATDGVTVTLYVGGLTAAHKWHQVSLDAGESAEFSGSLTLETAQTLGGVASSAASITTTVTGDEVT